MRRIRTPNPKDVKFLVDELGLDNHRATNILRKLDLHQAIKFILNQWVSREDQYKLWYHQLSFIFLLLTTSKTLVGIRKNKNHYSKERTPFLSSITSQFLWVIANISKRFEDAADEVPHELFANHSANIFLLFVILDYFLDLEAQFLGTLFDEVKERLDVHACHHLHVEDLKNCFYCVDYQINVSF